MHQNSRTLNLWPDGPRIGSFPWDGGCEAKIRSPKRCRPEFLLKENRSTWKQRWETTVCPVKKRISSYSKSYLPLCITNIYATNWASIKYNIIDLRAYITLGINICDVNKDRIYSNLKFLIFYMALFTFNWTNNYTLTFISMFRIRTKAQ